MNISERQTLYINELKKKKKLVVLPTYKDIHSWELIYRLKLYDYEKRNKQKENKKRPHSWIYIHDSHIASALNIKKHMFNSIMKYNSNASYSKGEGFYFNTEEECLQAINNIYNNLNKIRR